ncbi:MAG: 1-acyl-sn-glycerol-3-phosphate acyltransferase [Prevotella sp.]|nr:1-acyl-sn-glycerol-3-phosphate acyltransferase [Bacteroides sp.]MCM1366418.1 1-acyl-sn-glycerol-3-phosphate acyltransferase [Prevotella sp.]
MNFWGRILKVAGWSVEITAPHRDKCVICVAPHTSNWDFILGLFAYYSLGRKANFLMKEFWFFFPLGILLKKLGGIPVPKVHGGDLTGRIIELFKKRSYVNLAVTPEGTRSKTHTWRKGFLYIAEGANVPLQLGVIDFQNKKIIIKDEFIVTGNVDNDMKRVKDYYLQYRDVGKYPDKFSI